MKKVLMVSYGGLGNGGIQRVIMDIVCNLSDQFHFDIVVFTDEERYFDAEFQKYGTIFRIPNYKGPSKIRHRLDYYIRFPRIYRGLKKILKENGPYDVIHCHNYFEAAPCVLAAKQCGVPVRISHSHNAPPPMSFVPRSYQYLLSKIIHQCATHLVGCSQLACDYLFGINTGAISIPNAINLKRFDISRYSGPKIKHSFIHVANFGRHKNQSFGLDVFGVIQARWPDATLKLIGKKNEAYEKILRQKIKDLHLKNVEFLPSDSDIPALLAQSEYMIFPSLFEGLPLALLEAQTMQVKCFVSDSITREANLGWCTYLSLKEPANVWAQAVFEAENKPLPKPDIQKVSLTNYVEKIRSIYLGEIN